ncbi:MAG: hypothetical protein ACRD11_05900 [Terriglobia bacterium]
MKKSARVHRMSLAWVIVILCLAACGASSLNAAPRRHKKKESVSGNGPTARLYQLLDQSMDGKLDIYLIANIYPDPSKPGQQFQRVLHVVYNKNLYFGRFTIHCRSVSKLTPDQLSTYTPEQVFNFANADSEEFEKIKEGTFGQTGDLYLLASGDLPLSSSPITSEVQQEYDTLLTAYILPAVQKQIAAKQ